MSELRKRLEELKLMRAQDQALLDQLNRSHPDGVNMQARMESLDELNLAARIDQGVIDQLESLAAAETTILERLGAVLGWIGTGIATLMVVVGLVFTMNAGGPVGDRWGMFFVWFLIAMLVYGTGRALRYILSGK